MREKEAVFDHGKHMLYSKSARKLVLEDISTRCHGSEDLIWQRTRKRWSEFVETMPALGGKKNFQAGTVYDAVLFFAYYDVLPKKMTKDEFEGLCNALWVTPYRKLGRIGNLNRMIFLRYAGFAFKTLSKIAKKHEKEWPGNYTWQVEPFDREKGVRYRFLSCPIADFAKAHGFTFLMSAMCNGDYPMLKGIHAGLIRECTCAKDAYCDYWIMGDENEILKDHPIRKDEEGYLRN